MALPRPQSEADQYRLSQGMRDDATSYAPVVQQRLRDVADPTSRLMIARGRGNADMMQQQGPDQYYENPAARTMDTPFQRVMARSRALSRIGMMGEKAVYQQQFRDRVGLATIGQQFRANQAGDLATLGRQQAETNAARMRARQVVNAAEANTLGTIAGAATRFGVGYANRGGGGGGGGGGNPADAFNRSIAISNAFGY